MITLHTVSPRYRRGRALSVSLIVSQILDSSKERFQIKRETDVNAVRGWSGFASRTPLLRSTVSGRCHSVIIPDGTKKEL